MLSECVAFAQDGWSIDSFFCGRDGSTGLDGWKMRQYRHLRAEVGGGRGGGGQCWKVDVAYILPE